MKFKRLISLSLVILLSSTSMFVYAAEDDTSNLPAQSSPATLPDEQSTSAQNSPDTNTITDSVVQAVDSAITQADTVQDAVDEIATQQDAVNDAVLTGDNKIQEDEGGAISSTQTSTFATNVQNIVNDNSTDEITDDITAIKTDLDNVKSDTTTSIQDSQGAVDTVNTAKTAATEAQTVVTETTQKADELIDTIQNGDIPAAQEAATQLDTLLSDTRTTVEEKQTIITNMKAAFATLQASVISAENNITTNLSDAQEKTGEVVDDIEALEGKCTALQTSLTIAEEKLEQKSSAATEIQASINANGGLTPGNGNFDTQRKLLMSIVKNYYIANVVGDVDITDFVIERVVGFDRQDYNYYKVTYKVDGVEKVKYFNLDREDKRESSNPYNNLGTSKNIVIFPKSQEEIDADTYLKELYKDRLDYYQKGIVEGKNTAGYKEQNPNGKGEYDQLKADVTSGRFKLYYYVENGVTKYICQEELDDVIHTDREVVKDNETGKYTVDEIEITPFVENQNNAFHGNPILLNVRDDEDLTNFYTNSPFLFQKYKTYNDCVNQVASDVEDAKEKAEALQGAIDELVENRPNRVLNAIGDLDFDEFLAYFELEETDMTADEFMSLTVEEALELLADLLAKQEVKLGEALDALAILETKRDDIKRQLDERIPRPVPTTPSSSSEPTRSYAAINNETVIPDTITPLAGDTTQIITPTPNVVDNTQQVAGETDDAPDTVLANIDDTPVPRSAIDEEDTKEIEDPDTPLAANGTSRYPIYLWLLLFLLLVIIEAIRKMRKDKSMNNS